MGLRETMIRMKARQMFAEMDRRAAEQAAEAVARPLAELVAEVREEKNGNAPSPDA
jgi:hypothetical protein